MRERIQRAKAASRKEQLQALPQASHIIPFTEFTFPGYLTEPAHELIGQHIDAVVAGDVTRLMIFAPPQHGKLIAHDVPVLTLGGWKQHGDLRPGDYVFGRQGQPVRVLAISTEGEANREVVFSDGAVIACHAAHEWVVYRRGGYRPVEETWETDAMREHGLWQEPKGKRGGRAIFQVDANTRVHFPPADLPIPPYVVGAWLGDGAANKNCISLDAADESMVDRIKTEPMKRRRGIRAIRDIPPRPGRCIQVEGGVYLVGRQLLPTHNSELVSVRLPALWLGNHPDQPVLLTSYGASLAEDKSKQTRAILGSAEYQSLFPDIGVSEATRSGFFWRLASHRGSLLATGVGGPITGHGAWLGIIDDPYKSWEEAQSETIRRRVWQWYQNTFRTRIRQGGAIVIIMTRWHEDDVCGRLLKEQGCVEEGGQWTVLRLPALAETQAQRDENHRHMGMPAGQADPLDREPGQALCPIRFPAAELGRIQADVGPMGWMAEYQASPRAPEGNRFKRAWFDILSALPAGCRLFVRYWDTAGTAGGGAYTAGALLTLDREGYTYVVDVVRGQWAETERKRVMKQTAELDRQRYGPKGRVLRGRVWTYVEQEPGDAGKEAVQATIRHLAGYKVEADRASGSKDVRLDPFEGQAGAGNVKLIAGEWNAPWLDEMTALPNGAYRDQADATAGAYNKLALWRKRRPDWDYLVG